jgi:hypothetical protein
MALTAEDIAQISQIATQSALQAMQQMMLMNPRLGGIVQPPFEAPDEAEQADLMEFASRVAYPAPAYLKHRWNAATNELLVDKSRNGVDANAGLLVVPTDVLRRGRARFMAEESRHGSLLEQRRAEMLANAAVAASAGAAGTAKVPPTGPAARSQGSQHGQPQQQARGN